LLAAAAAISHIIDMISYYYAIDIFIIFAAITPLPLIILPYWLADAIIAAYIFAAAAIIDAIIFAYCQYFHFDIDITPLRH
jgi:hypothetical protein